jgi:hypothetical protein
MFCGLEGFGEEICRLMFGGNVIDLNFAVVNVMAHSVIAYIDMFGLAILGRIVRDIERRLTVGEERNRANCRGNLEFLKELLPSNCFACRLD